MGKSFVIFAANYLPNLGGVERYTYNLAKSLIRQGSKVTVVTSNVFDLPAREFDEGIDIYRTPCLNMLKGRYPVLCPSPEFFRLCGELRREPFDVCVVNSRFYLHSLLGVIFGKRYCKQCLVVDHATGHFTVNSPIWDFAGHIWEHVLVFSMKRWCSDYYGVSHACNDWQRHFGIEAKGVLYNSVDMEDIGRILSDEADLRAEKLGIACRGDRFNIVYAGRLIREKGLLKLIAAFERMNTYTCKPELYIAGEGPLGESVRELAATNKSIHYLGKLDFPDVIALLGKADVYVLPSDYAEGFPTTVLEAAACRCFIIASKAGGSKELVTDRRYGIILEENTIEELRDELERLILDTSGFVKSTVEATYRRCVENFTWDITAAKFIAIADRSEKIGKGENGQ